MPRAINTMLIFLFSLALAGGLLQSTGIAATLDLNGQLGAQEAANEVQAIAQEDVTTGAPTGDTLFGLYNVLGGRIGELLGMINPELTMLRNTGVPSAFIEGFLIPIATLVKSLGIIYFLRGISQ
jgi:hypothetical protein